MTNPADEGTPWTYLANDWLGGQTLADGAAYTYDARGRQTDLKTTLAGATLSEFAASGGGSPGGTSYAYDGWDELTQEASTRGGGYSNAFAYDGVTSGTTTGPGNPMP